MRTKKFEDDAEAAKKATLMAVEAAKALAEKEEAAREEKLRLFREKLS